MVPNSMDMCLEVTKDLAAPILKSHFCVLQLDHLMGHVWVCVPFGPCSLNDRTSNFIPSPHRLKAELSRPGRRRGASINENGLVLRM